MNLLVNVVSISSHIVIFEIDKSLLLLFKLLRGLLRKIVDQTEQAK